MTKKNDEELDTHVYEPVDMDDIEEHWKNEKCTCGEPMYNGDVDHNWEGCEERVMLMREKDILVEKILNSNHPELIQLLSR